MNQAATQDQRAQPDRRRRPTGPCDIWWGRRVRHRRTEDEPRTYLVDRFPRHLFSLGVLLLILSLTDGLFTLVLVSDGAEELNPIMDFLLNRGVVAFVFGKYLLSAAFLPVVLVLNRSLLFGTRLRVGMLIPIVVALYLVLIAYQIVLLTHRLEAPFPLAAGMIS